MVQRTPRTIGHGVQLNCISKNRDPIQIWHLSFSRRHCLVCTWWRNPWGKVSFQVVLMLYPCCNTVTYIRWPAKKSRNRFWPIPPWQTTVLKRMGILCFWRKRLWLRTSLVVSVMVRHKFRFGKVIWSSLDWIRRATCAVCHLRLISMEATQTGKKSQVPTSGIYYRTPPTRDFVRGCVHLDPWRNVHK